MTAYDPRDLTRLGRRETDERACRLWWTGSGVRFRTACRYLTLEAECSGHDFAAYLGVLADGAPVARLPLLPGRRVYPVLAGMDPGVTHEITILRDSQPGFDEEEPITLWGLETDGSAEPAPERERLIEFIGDSLTVGEGCAGPQSAAEWRMIWISHMGSFPALTAEKLKADSRVIALGGYGVWRSWDDNPDHVLGKLYDRLCSPIRAGDVPYDFSERKADAVVINLGTNDGGPFARAEDPAAAEEAFTTAAKGLLSLVRAHQPGARILWAYGLCGTAMTDPVRRAVEEYRLGGDENVGFLPLTDCAGDHGSRTHPSRAAHRRAAREIISALKDL